MAAAYHPKTDTVKMAVWMDDYFGKHEYGVQFVGDNNVYRPEEVSIPDKVFVPMNDDEGNTYDIVYLQQRVKDAYLEGYYDAIKTQAEESWHNSTASIQLEFDD